MFDPAKFIEEQVQTLRDRIKYGKVVTAVFRGIDSAVCAVLAYRAIGEWLLTVFVCAGSVEKGEAKHICNSLKVHNILTKLIDASPVFIYAPKGITDTEEQKKSITMPLILDKNDRNNRLRNGQFVQHLQRAEARVQSSETGCD